jgi:hypothetical protein
MAHDEKKVKPFKAPGDVNANTDDIKDAAHVPTPLPDLTGVEDKVQRILGALMERVNVLEAQCHGMPLHRPVNIPRKDNYNTDTVAGM